MSAYAAIIEAFPASVAAVHRRDHLGAVVSFRIAGPKFSVLAELARIVELCHGGAGCASWDQFAGAAIRVAHGGLRERHQLSPRREEVTRC
jgi:hypothetical protein